MSYSPRYLRGEAPFFRVETADGLVEDCVRRDDHITLLEARDARIEALERELAEATGTLPRLTQEMIQAAGEAHYGKRFSDHGGPMGVDLTANGTNYTFEQGVRRMWGGIRKHLKQTAANRARTEGKG